MSENRLSAAAQAAITTGKELLALFYKGQNGGELKSDHTLVTEADHRADQLIQEILREKFPQEGILSEEKSTVYPESKHVWVIDPLDGTVNFSHGLHYWGVSIAHFEDGHPKNGAIYFPVIDELYTASLGGGAFLNGQPLSPVEELDDELFPLFVHCSRMHERYEIKTRYKKRSLGAAAYHLCLVAKNTAILALESTPRIWDFAAGWLIIEEAGAAIKALDIEQPFPAQPGVDYGRNHFPILAARSTVALADAAGRIKPISRYRSL